MIPSASLPFSVAAVREPKQMGRLADRILPEARIHEMITLTAASLDKMLLRCLYATGARVSEMCALIWCHFQANGSSGQVTLFGKGGQDSRSRATGTVVE